MKLDTAGSGSLHIQDKSASNGSSHWLRSLVDKELQRLRLLYHNAPYWIFGAPDRLPIPPAKLRSLIWGPNADLRTFFKGEDDCNRMPDLMALLTRHGVRIEQMEAILDFGCGCGRDIRQLYGLRNSIRAKICGTDINPEQVDWCTRKLTFAEFSLNGPEPPLCYIGERFDLIYNYSVFTHLAESQQKSWVRELARILKPGGHLMLTVCGESYLHELTEMEKERFKAGRLVVRHEELAGIPSDYGVCAAYHPAEFVRRDLAAGFEIVAFIPGQFSIPGSMDQYLLKKPIAKHSSGESA